MWTMTKTVFVTTTKTTPVDMRAKVRPSAEKVNTACATGGAAETGHVDKMVKEEEEANQFPKLKIQNYD